MYPWSWSNHRAFETCLISPLFHSPSSANPRFDQTASKPSLFRAKRVEICYPISVLFHSVLGIDCLHILYLELSQCHTALSGGGLRQSWMQKKKMERGASTGHIKTIQNFSAYSRSVTQDRRTIFRSRNWFGSFVSEMRRLKCPWDLLTLNKADCWTVISQYAVIIDCRLHITYCLSRCICILLKPGHVALTSISQTVISSWTVWTQDTQTDCEILFTGLQFAAKWLIINNIFKSQIMFTTIASCLSLGTILQPGLITVYIYYKLYYYDFQI